MADSGSLLPPNNNQNKPNSSFFTSPRLFTGFISNCCDETESTMNSPTSILDTKPFLALKNPFWSESTTPRTPKPETNNLWEKSDTNVGLALVDSLVVEKSNSNLSETETGMVLFGSQLRIQVPPLPPTISPPYESPKSPCDFGIKTRNSHVRSFSPRLTPPPVKKSPVGSFSSLSASEMELSEDYTCVISYGPNPKTTHIFDDCVVESCCGVVKLSESRKDNGFLSNRSVSYPFANLLKFCYSCKKNLGDGKDIYMYRGKKAFCSSDCRCKLMMLEEDGIETLDSNFAYVIIRFFIGVMEIPQSGWFTWCCGHFTTMAFEFDAFVPLLLRRDMNN